jgi:hypothetical protein
MADSISFQAFHPRLSDRPSSSRNETRNLHRVRTPGTWADCGRRFTGSWHCGWRGSDRLPEGRADGEAVGWCAISARARRGCVMSEGHGESCGALTRGGRRELIRLLTRPPLRAQNRGPCGQIGGTGWKYASTSF